MVVGVGDLTIGDPNDSVSIASKRNGMPKYWTVNPIANVACWPAPGSTTAIGEKPRVRVPHGITWSMTVPNHRHARHCIEQCFKLGFGNVHRTRLVNHDDRAWSCTTSREDSSLGIGKQSFEVGPPGTSDLG
jgi:hypothetical protein